MFSILFYSDAVVSQVLDELGLNLSQELSSMATPYFIYSRNLSPSCFLLFNQTFKHLYVFKQIYPLLGGVFLSPVERKQSHSQLWQMQMLTWRKD